MKTKLLLLALTLLVFTQCRDDEAVEPVIPEKPVGEIPVGKTETDDFTIEGDIVDETPEGYTAEGTLFVEAGTEKVEVVSGTITVTTDDAGNLMSMEGIGTVQMPDVGNFKSFVGSSTHESSFIYNTGKYFKEMKDDFKSLPLRDTSYYFFFNILNLSPGEDATWKVKNAGLGMTSFFINLPFEELIIPTGSFSFELPSGTTKIGDKMVIGISGKGSFPFTPTVYEDSALNAVIQEKKAFSDISGMLYLSGEMSITKSMPYILSGDVVVKGDFNDIFENGFSGSECDIAMNGKLLFGNDIIDLLPVDLETELVNVTLRTYGQGIGGGPGKNGGVAFAGEFDDDAWVGTLLEAMVGKTVADNFPRSGNDGSMFVSFSDDAGDFALYVRAQFGMKIPGIGERELRKGIFYITRDEIQVSGGLGLPFIPANLYASGKIGFDGTIHLTGSATGDLEINNDLKFNSTLTIDIYNDSVTLAGNIDVPYQIGKVDVTGRIGSEGLSFKGNVDTQFRAGPLSLPLTNLEISGTHHGISLKGALLLNPTLPLAQVSGKINANELYLTGKVNTPDMGFGYGNDRVNIPVINLDFTASTRSGVRFFGHLDVPYGIATARIEGQMTASKDGYGYPEIFLAAKFSSSPKITFGGLSFPSSKFNMVLSTASGIQFAGRFAIHGGFGVADVKGKIQGKELTFEGNFGNRIYLGGLSFDAEMTVAVSSSGGVSVPGFKKSSYPVVVRGDVHTGIGVTLGTAGVVDWNGIPASYGNLTVAKGIGPLNLKGNVQFAFEKGASVYFNGEVCAAGSCINKQFVLAAQWDGISNPELCFIYCVSVKDIYDAIK